MKNEYDDFVEHPRYRRAPRITGLNSQTDLATGETYLHWKATTRMPNTAVDADLSRQSRATVPITHYYDVERTCRALPQASRRYRRPARAIRGAVHVENRSRMTTWEMAYCCVALIEAGVFHHRSEEGSQGAGLRPAP
jgi:hypothetical protein